MKTVSKESYYFHPKMETAQGCMYVYMVGGNLIHSTFFYFKRCKKQVETYYMIVTHFVKLHGYYHYTTGQFSSKKEENMMVEE